VGDFFWVCKGKDFFAFLGWLQGLLTFVPKKKCIFAVCYDKKSCAYSAVCVLLGCCLRPGIPLRCVGEPPEIDVDDAAV
jgi:hypothetical protein